MKYLMLVVVPPGATPGPDAPADPDAWVTEMDARRVRVMGQQLQAASAASTVRVRDGKRLVTDGPFAEAAEHIAGFDVLDCADLDEAIEVAGKHPVAGFGLLELRPFIQE
ncbi:MAG: YciI family protein [Jatrophihabitans sp.]